MPADTVVAGMARRCRASQTVSLDDVSQCDPHPELKLFRALESVFSLPTLEAWSLLAKLLPLEEL
jgi:hypothetical protein